MKKVFRILPLLFTLFGIVFALSFRGTNEGVAYIVCAACMAVALILLCCVRFKTQTKDGLTEEQFFKRIADGERFCIIFTVERLGKSKPNKKVFSLDVYPDGTDEDFLRKISAYTASKQEYARADELSLGVIRLTEEQAKRMKGMTLVMYEPDYVLLGHNFSYHSMLTQNKIVFDENKNPND